jgi:beta-lactamase superfamily II metal-dependent hydrolase
LKAIRELASDHRTIDLMVISHSDGDHLGDAADILSEFDVRRILHTGFRRDTATWKSMAAAIEVEVAEGAEEIDLGETQIEPGTEFELGPAVATFVAGWHEWTETNLSSTSELRNAISIVVRVEFKGKAVLFTGDTVGRRIGETHSACRDAEKIMVENSGAVPIAAEVMTAGHHGADNANSGCFIREVDPTYVIFSAGHEHEHPRQRAADRFIANGVLVENLFRTDRGDNEGDDEWIFGALRGCVDKPGDDDVEIVVSGAGELEVAYRIPSRSC